MPTDTSRPWKLQRLTRKRSDGSSDWSWCIVWTEDGSRRRFSLGTRDEAEAKRLAGTYWQERCAHGVETIGQIVQGYLSTLTNEKPSAALLQGDYGTWKVAHSAHRQRTAWQGAKDYFADKVPASLGEHTLAEYSAWRNRSVSTVRHEINLVKSAMKWAGQHGSLLVMPTIKAPPMQDSVTEHLTKQQFAQFLEGCAMPHVRLFAILAVTTGARATALLQLKWSQVDRVRRIVNLDGLNKPGHKPRATVPLNDRAMEALRVAEQARTCDWVIEYRSGPIAAIKRGVRLAADRSGVDVHPHMFRHSAAVWMAEARTPMDEIASFLGHRNVEITRRVYARYSPDYLQKAASALDW